jgi:hypothetical protein
VIVRWVAPWASASTVDTHRRRSTMRDVLVACPGKSEDSGESDTGEA